MKIRAGFVSNSSSSSFVIGKNFMTKKQIKEFKSVMGKLNDHGCSSYDDDPTDMYEGLEIDYDENTCISESKNYFFGDVGYGHCEIIVKYMELNSIDIEEFILEG